MAARTIEPPCSAPTPGSATHRGFPSGSACPLNGAPVPTPAIPMRTLFRLLFEYASDCIKHPPSQLQLEELCTADSQLPKPSGNNSWQWRPDQENIRLAAIKSFMRYMEYRVPSALEQSNVFWHPAKKQIPGWSGT